MYELWTILESWQWLYLFEVILADANVTCIIQDDCILPCSFRPTTSVVIHWYKQQIPVHSYYYNKDQFGLQNKHFSGRTSLFNVQIPHGNASLLLKRVKVQDKGRYKCYTSTRKGNQEAFINLEVKGQYNAAPHIQYNGNSVPFTTILLFQLQFLLLSETEEFFTGYTLSGKTSQADWYVLVSRAAGMQTIALLTLQQQYIIILNRK